jgi:hypothetical protein
LTVSSTGTAEAIYEVLSVKGQVLQENLALPFFISYTANPGANTPALGTATVGGSFAPISTDTNASATDTIPRFADTSVAVNAFSIVKCATHILFPFITNQAGFDTGFAIANTSMDQYGTSTQIGTCTFNFFGDKAPAAVTTASAVAPGTVYVNLASVLSPGFQGYVIVDCQFQFAHGFAFITQIGTQEDERFDRDRKIACGASCGSEDSKDIGRLILRTAGRCKVRPSKGIVSTRAAPKRRIENGESMNGLPSMWNPKEIVAEVQVSEETQDSGKA